MQSDRSRALAEKETLEHVYKALIAEHRALQANYVRQIACTVMRQSKGLTLGLLGRRYVGKSRRNCALEGC
jgi:hypothetical protein